MALTSNPGHPDEVVKPENEVPSELIAEAKLRQENADSEWATPQEKKQAAVEKAHALSTRPDGSYAQLHETEEATLAVADEQRLTELKKEQDKAREGLTGAEPANSEAGVRREETTAQMRAADARTADTRSTSSAKDGGKTSK